jgi:hypothetical protein
MDGTGDITNYKNIEYYVKNHGQNDFVTGDCGLSIFLKDLGYKMSFSMYVLMLGLLKNGGTCVLKKRFPINNNQELYMLYICYLSFDRVYMYKPRQNYQSNEYYLICTGYNQIKKELFDELLNFLKNYSLKGMCDYNKMDDKFLLQLDEGQNILQDNMNNFIRRKIYFVDNFHEMTDNDWAMIKNAIKEKINEWMDDFPLNT